LNRVKAIPLIDEIELHVAEGAAGIAALLYLWFLEAFERATIVSYGPAMLM